MRRFSVLMLFAGLFASCANNDEGAIPSHFNFESLGVVDADFLDMGSGMQGVTGENILYIAHRSQRHGNVERIARFNLSDNTVTERLFGRSDYVTKRIHVAGDDLIVIGGSYINTYNDRISSEPVSVLHGERLTRFGSFMYEGEIYIFGGDLDGVAADKIKKWNATDVTFVTVATLPESRYWTSGEVVGDELFIFGGQQTFEGDFGEDEIYIIDLQDFSVETLRLPEVYNRAFTTAVGANIFVAGQVWRDEDIITRMGIFNVQDRSFREVTHNLNDVDVSSIYGLSSVGNRLYAIHGDSEERHFTLRELIF